MRLPGVVTRILNPGLTEHRAGGYTNAALDALLANATYGTAEATATAAVVSAAGVISSPFAIATVRGTRLFSPPMLVDLARRLMLSGNYVALIDVDRDGQIEIRPAQSFEVAGTSRRRVYELTIQNPTGEPTKRRSASDGVLHIMVNPSSGEPWRGVPPWRAAKLTSDTLAYIERSLSQDSSIPTGALLPVPDGLSTTQAAGVRNALVNGKGVIMVTAKSQERDEMDAIRKGAWDYITKPLVPDVIEDRIRMALTHLRVG